MHASTVCAPFTAVRFMCIWFCTNQIAAGRKSSPCSKNRWQTSMRLSGTTAPEATGFIQNYPAYGQPATNQSVVKILYDDEAVYIGAYLYDDPLQIRNQITGRDGEQRQNVDYFSVFFDTYHDQQNGFQFLVTSANVQTDAKLGGGLPTVLAIMATTAGMRSGKATARKSDGWVVEIRIPYISLRFAKREVQTWGLQFLRFTRRNNESAFWNPVNPNIAGFVNQFGGMRI